MTFGQAAGTPPNIITGLPEMKWRKLSSPAYDMANAKGGWDLAEGSFPYMDGKSHDNMGRKEIPLSFRFLFLNTVVKGSFPELFNKWFQAVAIDPTPGKLLHPIIGELDARVVDWDLELTASRTAGVVFAVNWTDTVLDPGNVEKLKPIFVDAIAAATAADEGMSVHQISYPTGERTTSLLDMINQINGLIFSARLTAQGMLNQAIGIVTKITETVDNLTTHDSWALSSNLKKLWAALVDLKDASAKQQARQTGILLTPREMTLTEVASEVDNTLGEIMGLNPGLLAAPYVQKRTAVAYFTD